MTKHVLILGAGLSTTDLIDYMLRESVKNKWKIRLGDISADLAREKINGHKNGEAFFFNVDNQDQRAGEIRKADLVISMLPFRFHYLVAKECIRYGVHMVTASYASKEILSLHEEALRKNVLILNEAGLDPGIDHMSAMQVINRLKEEGAKLIAFESAAGGLVAPNYDNNPWNYKFTWAPRNVVLAGKDGARFMHNGKFKYIPYHKLFSRYELINIPGYGQFEVYPNRDSLVQLGATDDTYTMDNTEDLTHREFINSFTAFNIIDPVEKKIADYLGVPEDSTLMNKLKWLGLFEDTRVGIPDLTPARVLQHILEKKWKMDPEDKDMIVMQHQFDYMRLGEHRKIYSTMVTIGDDTLHTAMSKTVGLPVAIISKLILQGKIKMSGVELPVHREIYEPVLEELKEFGIAFRENDLLLS